MIVIRIPVDVPELRAKAGDGLTFNPVTRRFVVSHGFDPGTGAWAVAWGLLTRLAGSARHRPQPLPDHPIQAAHHD